MISNEIQIEILEYYYDLWFENPLKCSAKLKEMKQKYDSPIEIKILEANAQYLAEKNLLGPRITLGFRTHITIEGVLFIESIHYSPDVKIRIEILKRIKEKYLVNPDQYTNVHKIAEEMKISQNQMYRSLLILKYLGFVKLQKVLNGINGVKITASGIDTLNQPNFIEYESNIMSLSYFKLYKLENILRVFIEDALRNEYGNSWWEKGIPYKVKKKALNNKIKDGGNLSNINYTNFVHLKKIIQQQNNWKKIFESIFESQIGIISRLEELEPIRHNIAHTRMLSKDEITKLDLFLRDIEKILNKK